MAMEIKPVALVLADISGYTRFVKEHDVSLLHAEAIITDLLEAVIDGAEFPLTLAKLEGDAVFLYALTERDAAAAAQDVARQTLKFFDGFRSKQVELIAKNPCPCQACTTIERLRLKAILHSGQAAFKKIRQFEELAGADVILAHRLLKNSIASKEYILMTSAFHALSGSLPGQTPEPRTEQAEGLGQVTVQVFYPGGQPVEAAKIAPAPEAVKQQRGRWLAWHVRLRRWGLKRPAGEFTHLSG